MKTKNRDEIDRRTVLKSSTAVATLGGLQLAMTDIAGAQSEFGLGEKQFVETKLEHVDVPLDRWGHSDGLAPYVVEPERGRLFLDTVPVEAVKSKDVVVSRGGRFFQADERFQLSRQIFGETDYRRLQEKSLPVESGYDIPEATVSSHADESITVTIEETEIDVPAGEERTRELSPVEVEIRQETVTITPVVTIYNHGTLDVYGKDGVTIYPLNSEDIYATQRVQSLSNGIQKGAVAGEKREQDSILVVTEEGDGQ